MLKDRILYEDNHLIAVNKLPGDLSQGDATGDAPLPEAVKEYLKEKYNKPGKVFLGVVHRLDRPVSGVLLFARTSKALERMNRQFKEREVQKTYWALVEKAPRQEEGTLVHFLEKDRTRNITLASANERPGTKRAELTFRLERKFPKQSLLSVQPKTGRPHQIRVQLAAMGCPIIGDLKYGYSGSGRGGAIMLHARKLEFIHPVQKKALTIIAPPPDDVLWNVSK